MSISGGGVCLSVGPLVMLGAVGFLGTVAEVAGFPVAEARLISGFRCAGVAGEYLPYSLSI